MRRTLTAAFAATLLAGALSTGALAQSPAAGGTGGTLDGTSWTLTEYLSPGALIPVAPGYIVDATFRDATVAGFSGCNEYVGSATVDGATLAIGPIATTLRMCKMAIPIEQDYLAALALSATFTAAPDGLTIYDASGAQVLGYAPAPADPLDGPWAVTGFNNGAQAVVSPIEGTELTVNFGPDGQVFGSSGCNTYNGSFTTFGPDITIGALSVTGLVCDPAVMEQENTYLARLQLAATYQIDGNQLRLAGQIGSDNFVLIYSGARP